MLNRSGEMRKMTMFSDQEIHPTIIRKLENLEPLTLEEAVWFRNKLDRLKAAYEGATANGAGLISIHPVLGGGFVMSANLSQQRH